MDSGKISRSLAGLLVVGATTAFATSYAFAADLHVPPPQQIVTPEMTDWTGFYVGAHVGLGWGGVVVDKGHDGDHGIDDVHGFGTSGWLGGVQAGYNYQSGNAVFGIEADLALAGIGGDSAHMDHNKIGGDISWIGTVRGRLGFAADRFFLYGTAGVAAAGANGWLHRTDSDDHFRHEDVRVGWVAGVGAEMMLDSNISVKAEYLFHDFGSNRRVFNHDWGHFDDKPALSTIKVGLNVHF